MTTRRMISKRTTVPLRPYSPFLTRGFWFLGRTKWGWLATLLSLWGLTLLTKTASTAFLIWLLD